MNHKILIIDNELKLLKLLGMIVANEGFEVLQASSARSAMTMLEHSEVDVILSDVGLPDAFGVDLVKQIKARFPAIEIILMTAYGNIPDGIQAMKNGAYDYIVKGDDNDKIIPLVHKALEKSKENSKKISHEQKNLKIGFEDIIGETEAILISKRLAEKVAKTDSTVLLTGETGTGKEVFANAIHHSSKRNNGKFVALNCSAFSREILESELFGHKKGSFTGAVSDKKGLIEEANGGTLFLDEIAEMPIDLQAKFLRVLESGEFIKIGDTKTSKSDFRLIAATNKNLKEESSKGNFREDLYFRINIFEINLPPLRERKKDIPKLAQFYIKRFAESMEIKDLKVNDGYLEKLQESDWKGNIRELKNTLEHSMILMEENELKPENLSLDLVGNSEVFALSTIEKQHILKVLNYTKGNKAEAARLLNIGIATLYRKLVEYGLK
ncbi:sigma-54 dependent transcriptional regulator [Chryseobacterium koreense]|uniref:sigma-54-dependent transcriptional regulator n=1 Tax=Chryseobacterium koreense TaxID=232216 RepID=UPI0026ECC134|nr:sigma-54 dependent transcriptional regulator [Chryseobacterium koreense]